MSQKRIAVVSDLHIGPKARHFDLRPAGVPSFPGEKGYLDYLKDRVDSDIKGADFLVVPGDITDHGTPDQFRHAAIVLAKVAQILGVKKEHIIFVPGNHDLNWSVCKLDELPGSSFWKDYRFAALMEAADLFRTRSRDAARQLDRPPYFLIHEEPDTVFVTFNSAAFDYPEQTPHHGRARQEDLEVLKEELKRKKIDKAKLKIFVMHHHPHQYSEVTPDHPDFSILVNAENLMGVLYEERFDLMIHGHKHKPRVKILADNKHHPIVTLACGSFSVSLPHDYAGVVGNQFHLVEVHGRDGESEQVFGRIKSWSFAGIRGWVESVQDYHGIPHVVPYGTYDDAVKVEKKLREAVASAIAAHGHATHDMIVGNWPLVAYLHSDILWSVLPKAVPEKYRLAGTKGGVDYAIVAIP